MRKSLFFFVAALVFSGAEAKGQTATGLWHSRIGTDTLVVLLLEDGSGGISGTAVLLDGERIRWSVSGSRYFSEVVLRFTGPSKNGNGTEPERIVFRGRISSFAGISSITGKWSVGNYALSATQLTLQQMR